MKFFHPDTFKKRKLVQISCSEINKEFDFFAVVSNYEDISRMVDFFQKQCLQKLKILFLEVACRLTKYTKEQLQEHFHDKENENYRIFCRNVLMYYIIRYVLHDMTIPLIPPFCQHCKKKDEDFTFKKCSRCRIYNYCSKECQLMDWNHHKHHCCK